MSRDLPETLSKFLGSDDARRLPQQRSWIVSEVGGTEDSAREDLVALARVRRALWAIQLIHPVTVEPNIGWVEAITNNVSYCRNLHRRSTLHGPIWSRLYCVSSQDLEDLPKIVAGLAWAEDNEPRIMNSLAFLDHGLISRQPMIRAMMLTISLDLILNAGDRATFKSHLARLLGEHSPVFPVLGDINCQPKYSVTEMAGDLYWLRSLMAHGKPIAEELLRARSFEDKDGNECFADQDYPYYEILAEAGSAMLCRAIRKILLSDELRWTFSASKEWKKYLSKGSEDEAL